MNYLKFITAGIFLVSSNLIFNEISASANTGGCGSGDSWYLLRILTPISAQEFDPACHVHDKCYETVGTPKGDCDRAFHNQMLGICASNYHTWVARPYKIHCNGRADMYYRGVQTETAQNAYDAAQKDHKPSVANVLNEDNEANSYFIQRIGEHSEWLLTHTGNTNLWNAIQSAAQRDASSTSSPFYRKRVAEHSEWLLTHTNHADLWNAIQSAAKRDAKINGSSLLSMQN